MPVSLQEVNELLTRIYRYSQEIWDSDLISPEDKTLLLKRLEWLRRRVVKLPITDRETHCKNLLELIKGIGLQFRGLDIDRLREQVEDIYLQYAEISNRDRRRNSSPQAPGYSANPLGAYSSYYNYQPAPFQTQQPSYALAKESATPFYPSSELPPFVQGTDSYANYGQGSGYPSSASRGDPYAAMYTVRVGHYDWSDYPSNDLQALLGGSSSGMTRLPALGRVIGSPHNRRLEILFQRRQDAESWADAFNGMRLFNSHGHQIRAQLDGF